MSADDDATTEIQRRVGIDDVGFESVVHLTQSIWKDGRLKHAFRWFRFVGCIPCCRSTRLWSLWSIVQQLGPQRPHVIALLSFARCYRCGVARESWATPTANPIAGAVNNRSGSVI